MEVLVQKEVKIILKGRTTDRTMLTQYSNPWANKCPWEGQIAQMAYVNLQSYKPQINEKFWRNIHMEVGEKNAKAFLIVITNAET